MLAICQLEIESLKSRIPRLTRWLWPSGRVIWSREWDLWLPLCSHPWLGLAPFSFQLARYLSSWPWGWVWGGVGVARWLPKANTDRRANSSWQTHSPKACPSHCCRLLCEQLFCEWRVKSPKDARILRVGGSGMRSAMASRLPNKRIGWMACPVLACPVLSWVIGMGPTNACVKRNGRWRAGQMVERTRSQGRISLSARGVYVMHSGGMHMCALAQPNRKRGAVSGGRETARDSTRSVCEQSLDCVIIIVSSVAFCAPCLFACIVSVAALGARALRRGAGPVPKDQWHSGSCTKDVAPFRWQRLNDVETVKTAAFIMALQIEWVSGRNNSLLK